MLAIIKKYGLKIYMKYTLKKSRKYSNKECDLSYLFIKKKRSDKLLVVFSGFPGKKEKPVYNYILKFKNLNCNRLYILDDFGYDYRGAYYLGKDKDLFIDRAVTDLIEKVISNNNVSKENVITCGSSKGGYASLYFAIKNNYGTAVAGAPQVILGDYLSIDEHKEILSYIAGGTSRDEVEFVNEILLNELNRTKKCPRLYLHVGKKEREDMKHMDALCKALESKSFSYEMDYGDYDSHGQIGYFFPSFAIQSIKKELSR